MTSPKPTFTTVKFKNDTTKLLFQAILNKPERNKLQDIGENTFLVPNTDKMNKIIDSRPNFFVKL